MVDKLRAMRWLVAFVTVLTIVGCEVDDRGPRTVEAATPLLTELAGIPKKKLWVRLPKGWTCRSFDDRLSCEGPGRGNKPMTVTWRLEVITSRTGTRDLIDAEMKAVRDPKEVFWRKLIELGPVEGVMFRHHCTGDCVHHVRYVAWTRWGNTRWRLTALGQFDGVEADGVMAEAIILSMKWDAPPAPEPPLEEIPWSVEPDVAASPEDAPKADAGVPG